MFVDALCAATSKHRLTPLPSAGSSSSLMQGRSQKTVEHKEKQTWTPLHPCPRFAAVHATCRSRHGKTNSESLYQRFGKRSKVDEKATIDATFDSSNTVHERVANMLVDRRSVMHASGSRRQIAPVHRWYDAIDEFYREYGPGSGPEVVNIAAVTKAEEQ